MLSNNEVFNFQGSNIELCTLCGKTPNDDSPPHWANFTARSLKEKAGVAIAAGQGDQEFNPGRSGRKAKTDAPVSAPVIVALPVNIAAIMPAMTIRLQLKGHDVSNGLKQWLLEESTPADPDVGGEAIIPDEVTEFLGMFGMDTQENEITLLAYAGVKTLRMIRIERIKDAIKVLSGMNLDKFTDDRLDCIERALVTFAITGDSDAE